MRLHTVSLGDTKMLLFGRKFYLVYGDVNAINSCLLRHQADESDGMCLSKRQNSAMTAGVEPRTCPSSLVIDIP